jgi:hypothetical protein
VAPCVAARLHSDSWVVVGVALDGVATDLNHSSVGLIVAALAAAARLDARDLGELVRSPGCGHTGRKDHRMRTRIEIGRARIRTPLASPSTTSSSSTYL